MSGRKNFLNNYQIVSAGDLSQATVTSSVVNIQGLDNVGIQANITSGTASGTFDVQISADHKEDSNGNIITAGNWIELGTPYQATITSGSPANVYFDLNQLSSPFVRLLWTKSSGTGAFDAFAVGKMI
jgi:hypothetical protein